MRFLITGGCGFVGANAAMPLARGGHEVTLFDDLSRRGGRDNLAWLRGQDDFELVEGDVRAAAALERAVAARRFDALLQLAAQVAVTTSVRDPRRDFEVNALGTLNVLEAVRLRSPGTAVLYASTNKVYGGLEHRPAVERATRYELPDLPLGVSESEPLDFQSPYGPSKGAADQYVADYARIYGLRTVCCRQSCIYGERQFGVEDQGWVAWFTIAQALRRPVTIFGTG